MSQITLNTPEQIAGYRLLMLASALKLEIKGIYPIKGARTAYTVIKKEFALKGSRQKVLDKFNALLVEAGIKQA